MSRIWILGAVDHEMTAIEQLLRESKETAVYAVSRDGKRVHPGNMYQATGHDGGRSDGVQIGPGDHVIFVECDIPTAFDAGLITRIDHHRPGDPGYGLPPERFLEASAIGQVLAVVGRQATDEQIITAAADHCLGAAYFGLCPGVDKKELLKWRMEQKAKVAGVTAAIILEYFRQTLSLLTRLSLGDDDILDCTGWGQVELEVGVNGCGQPVSQHV